MAHRQLIYPEFDVVRCSCFFSKKLGRYVYAEEVGLYCFTFVFKRHPPANDVKAASRGPEPERK